MRYPTMIFHFNDQARPRRAAGRQAGGTFLGIILGIVFGLAAALGVAIYVAKVPVPFVNKNTSRTSAESKPLPSSRSFTRSAASLFWNGPTRTR